MSGPPRGRRPAGGDARGAILAAARRLFGELGYRRATLRAIARAAGVDPRLVLHYFGSKQELFIQSVELPVEPETIIERVFVDVRMGVGRRVAEMLLGVMEEPTSRSVMTGLIRSAASEPQAAELIREVLTRRMLMPVAQRLGGPAPELRAGLIASQIVGLGMARHIVGIGPLVDASRDQLIEALAPVFEHYLAGDWVGGEPDGTPSRGPRRENDQGHTDDGPQGRGRRSGPATG